MKQNLHFPAIICSAIVLGCLLFCNTACATPPCTPVFTDTTVSIACGHSVTVGSNSYDRTRSVQRYFNCIIGLRFNSYTYAYGWGSSHFYFYGQFACMPRPELNHYLYRHCHRRCKLCMEFCRWYTGIGHKPGALCS